MTGPLDLMLFLLLMLAQHPVLTCLMALAIAARPQP